MKSNEQILKWLGSMLPDQKIKGFPSGVTEQGWTQSTGGGGNLIKLNDISHKVAYERVISPTWLTGIYQPTDGSVDTDALSDLIATLLTIGGNLNSLLFLPRTKDTKGIVDITNAATRTLTAVANHVYRVIMINHTNEDRGHGIECTFTEQGGAPVSFLHTTGGAAAGDHLFALGGSNTSQAGGIGDEGGNLTEIWLQPGDAIAITDIAWVTGDDSETNFIYEDYVL